MNKLIWTHRKYFKFALIFLIFGCLEEEKRSDGYGNFEAIETIISAEISGRLLKFEVEEGEKLEKEAVTGEIDCTDFHLKKEQINAQKKVILSKKKNILATAEVQKQQKTNLKTELARVENLIKDNAATKKQYDDLDGNIQLIDKQIQATEVQNSSIGAEIETLDWQIKQLEENIKKCTLKNPVSGTVLVKYTQENELAVMGKALYKVADLSKIYLRAYISGDQLASIKLGQTVKVLTDKNKKENNTFGGKITWISQNAEFTPKIIQTKEERVNLVYAIKILVNNDGTIKIGMPGEVNFR